MLEQRYEREEMVRRGGKGRIEEVEGVKKEEGESFGLQRQVLFTAMGNGAAAKGCDGLGHLGFSVKLLFSRRQGWMIVDRSPGSILNSQKIHSTTCTIQPRRTIFMFAL
jgi:hypothetical protein